MQNSLLTEGPCIDVLFWQVWICFAWGILFCLIEYDIHLQWKQKR